MSVDNTPEYEEWVQQEQNQRVNNLRRAAKRAYGKASLLLDLSDPSAEKAARSLLAAAARAYWNAEETVFESITHEEMDGYGKWVRESFECHLAYEEGAYYQKCPVAIAHKRFGFSVGFTVRTRLCSICGDDVVDCIHDRQQLYDVPGGIGPTGHCRICGSPECSEHSPTRTYKAAQVEVVTEIVKVHEVSMVKRPAQPEARATSIPIDLKALRRHLGPDFRPGIQVNCDRCLKSCSGIEEIPGLK